MELTGIVKNGVVVLEGAPPLPEGTRVKISVEAEAKPPQTLREVLMEYAGCMTDLPSDFAAQHDHYIHGTPKR